MHLFTHNICIWNCACRPMHLYIYMYLYICDYIYIYMRVHIDACDFEVMDS